MAGLLPHSVARRMIESRSRFNWGKDLFLAVEVRQRLVGLLDYVEQVVRLDERVAFQLSEYRLSDGSTFAITKSDTENLPGVRHDSRDDDGQVWLEVERLGRKEPPRPPAELAEWIVLSPNPEKLPESTALPAGDGRRGSPGRGLGQGRSEVRRHPCSSA